MMLMILFVIEVQVKIFIIRHFESEANVQHILAGRKDYPLSPRGAEDAKNVASRFLREYRPQIVYCSPLIRALQSTIPFVISKGTPIIVDERLVEHDIGVFAGRTYSDVESDPRYENNRTKRWEWRPPLGETYEEIAARVESFFSALSVDGSDCLIVTHAVTMRIIRGLLENTFPEYPEHIPKNGEMWEVDFRGVENSHVIATHLFDDVDYRNNRV